MRARDIELVREEFYLQHHPKALPARVEKVARSREDQSLALLDKPESRNASQRDLANQLGWVTRDGRPYQMLVSRTITTLKKRKACGDCAWLCRVDTGRPEMPGGE